MHQYFHAQLTSKNETPTVEAVFAALKEHRGRRGSLRSRITDTQSREPVIQAISYNMDMVSREEIENGNLTKDTLEAMAAA